MKNLFLIFAVVFAAVSCKKDDLKPGNSSSIVDSYASLSEGSGEWSVTKFTTIVKENGALKNNIVDNYGDVTFTNDGQMVIFSKGKDKDFVYNYTVNSGKTEIVVRAEANDHTLRGTIIWLNANEIKFTLKSTTDDVDGTSQTFELIRK